MRVDGDTLPAYAAKIRNFVPFYQLISFADRRVD
jgi:hypothetical protein